MKGNDKGSIDYTLPQKCAWCGRIKPLHTHHLIPRWLEDDNSPEFEVCNSCHRRLEIAFDNFVKWGSFVPRPWRNLEKDRAQSRKYARNFKHDRTLFRLTLYHYIAYRVYVASNMKTGHTSVLSQMQVYRFQERNKYYRRAPAKNFKLPYVDIES